MALIECKDCGKEISDEANNCPSCGRPLVTSGEATASFFSWGCGTMAVLFFLLLLMIS
ncbi:zinc-ribbon domain-containing protein [Gammaproteobacteria bacterium]|nr:zinc-ribbon domain-containing protein [Gammaproteobacteria bacterium]